ncbi:protein prune homolog 2 [Nilaparvata lugens]|uniref:protein prune homolog 2 n=1 Tax=Nilaparvata lugens TaxID=108931 RepID=UPI00193E9D05|nr:protein prune homolog 2 [Nilaparvata lugens]
MQCSPDSPEGKILLNKNEIKSSDADKMDVSDVSTINSPSSDLSNELLDNRPIIQGKDANPSTKITNGISRKIHPVTSHPLDNTKDFSVSLESLEMELPVVENFTFETADFPNSPRELRQALEAKGVSLPKELDSGATGLSEDEEEDHSIFQAVLSPDCQDVRLKREEPRSHDPNAAPRRRKIALPLDLSIMGDEDQLSSVISDEDLDQLLSPDLESPDELEDSILEKLDEATIPELTAEEERAESRHWQECRVGGEERRIDMRVIEPFKRVLSHGGYLNAGSHNAIIVFSACFLPHHGRVDYNYVMDNLFFYVLSTLDQLVTEDYVLVYLHGGTAKDCMTKPFISSKFSKKLAFINSLAELGEILPLEQASIPERVKQYDRIKQSIESQTK